VRRDVVIGVKLVTTLEVGPVMVTVADAGLADRHRTRAGHDLALWQMHVAHEAPVTGLGLKIDMPA
jgi:hypothetical protein